MDTAQWQHRPCRLSSKKPDRYGYPIAEIGDMYTDGKRHRTNHHRAVWMRYFNILLSYDETLDHLCKNKICIEVTHMLLLPRDIHSSKDATREYCKRGHSRDPENLWISKTGVRHCRLCWKKGGDAK